MKLAVMKRRTGSTVDRAHKVPSTRMMKSSIKGGLMLSEPDSVYENVVVTVGETVSVTERVFVVVVEGVADRLVVTDDVRVAETVSVDVFV